MTDPLPTEPLPLPGGGQSVMGGRVAVVWDQPAFDPNAIDWAVARRGPTKGFPRANPAG